MESLGRIRMVLRDYIYPVRIPQLSVDCISTVPADYRFQADLLSRPSALSLSLLCAFRNLALWSFRVLALAQVLLPVAGSLQTAARRWQRGQEV
jgi:hypothetical protein